MVGVISLSLGTILERIQRCRDDGVRLFQISLPSWGALNDRELFCFFDSACGSFPDCQFLHYNLPRAKRIVTGQEYGRIAEAHPNLVGTKNTGDSLAHIQSLLEDAPQLQHFLSETGFVYGSLLGECGILASLIMNWPKLHALLNLAGVACPDARWVMDAIESQGTVDFVSELLSFRGDFQLQEREPLPDEVGRAARDVQGALVVEVRRGGRRIGCWQDKSLVIEPGDRLLVIDSDALLKAPV